MLGILFRSLFLFAVICFALSANSQEITFKKIDSCVDQEPRTKDIEKCTNGYYQGFYKSQGHYAIRGVFSLATPYIKYLELCGRPRDVLKKNKINLDMVTTDFICFDESRKWVLFHDFDIGYKSLGIEVIRPLRIDYYTCSTNNLKVNLVELNKKIGPRPLDRGNILRLEEALRDERVEDLVIYRYETSLEEVEATLYFNSHIQWFLNCPAGVVLEIKIGINGQLYQLLDYEYGYQKRRSMIR